MHINWIELIKNKNTRFNCKTNEIANDLIKILYDHGYKWRNNRPYTENNNWGIYRENICYSVTKVGYIVCGDKNAYDTHIINIIDVETLLYKRKPFKLSRITSSPKS